jgi:hypothetical protein
MLREAGAAALIKLDSAGYGSRRSPGRRRINPRKQNQSAQNGRHGALPQYVLVGAIIGEGADQNKVRNVQASADGLQPESHRRLPLLDCNIRNNNLFLTGGPPNRPCDRVQRRAPFSDSDRFLCANAIQSAGL